MIKNTKKIMAFVLSFVLLFSMLSVGVMAEAISREDLVLIVEECEAIFEEEEFITADTFANFKEAYDNAVAVLANEEPSLEEIKIAYLELESAVNEIEFTMEMSKEDLEVLILMTEEFLAMLEGDFTAEELAEVNAALENAKTVVANEGCTAEEINEAYWALDDAISALMGEAMILINDEYEIMVISSTKSIPMDTELSVLKITDGERFNKINGIFKEISNKLAIYDISLSNPAGNVVPKEKVLVMMALPEGYDETASKVYAVVDDKEVEQDSFIYEGALIFTADHFSEYVIADTSSKDAPTAKTEPTNVATTAVAVKASVLKVNPKTGESTYPVVISLLVLGVSLAGVCVLKRKQTAGK